MIDILNIIGEPIFDDCIVKIETHTYNPFANTTFGYSDEIEEYPATGFVHVTVRKFFLRQRKIDDEKEKRSDANDL